MAVTVVKKWFLFGLCLTLWFSTLAFSGGDASGNADTQIPSIPTGLIATEVTRTTFTLNWTNSTDNFGVKEYRVFRNEKLVGTSLTNSFSVTSLTLNTIYKMRVVAVDHSGNLSKSSTTLTVKTLSDTMAPQAPLALQASKVGLNSFQLNWQAAVDDVGVVRYEVYLDGVLRATNKISKNTLSTFALLNGLRADTTYILTVKAFDSMNNNSGASLPLEVETLADTLAPLRVTGLSLDSFATDGFRLMWEKSVDNTRISEYEVFRNGSSLGKTSLNNWTLSGLQPATAYQMNVIAYDESGNASPISQTLVATTNAEGVSPKHKLTIVAVSKPVSKGVTSISFRLAEASNITVKVYNHTSQLLQTPLENVPTKSGVAKVNLGLAALGSGEYLVKIIAKKSDATETTLWRVLSVDLTPPLINILHANVDTYTAMGPIQASVSYTLSEPVNVSIKVLNSANKTVRTFAIKPTSFPGYHTLVWDGKSNSGVLQSAGEYTVQIDAKDLLGTSATKQSTKIVLRPNLASLFDVFEDKNATSLANVGSLTQQNHVAFNPARWAFTSGQINWANYPSVTPFNESSVFRTELTYRADSTQADRGWSMRIGKGGNIYSIKLPVVGEISPPSFRQPGWNLLSPWNDDGMTTTLNSSSVSNNDAVMNVYGNGYIHGSGMYISPSADSMNNKPFYSPQFADYYDADERSYATVNWGLVPKPSVNRGEIMIYSKYRDVGNGVIELNYYYYNFGAINYDFAEAPWWMVRRSLFPDQIRGTTGANFEVFDRTYGINHTFNVNSFAGWGASTQDATNPNAMTAAMVWGKDKDWSTQSALKNSGGDYWQIRTSAAAYGKVNDLARDGQLLTSVIFPLIKPGEGFHFRRYLVFGKLANVAQVAASLVNQADYKRIEFAQETSGRLPIYATTRDGQSVLSTSPPAFGSVPIGYSSPIPLKGSQPLMLMKNVNSGQYFLSTDPYAVAGKKSFVNPYSPGDAKYQTYLDRVIYQPFDGKTEWVSLLGYVLPLAESGVPTGYTKLSDATAVSFVKGEKLNADQLMLFTE